MPQLLLREPIAASSKWMGIVKYDIQNGEEIFLSYTHGREMGPGIVRPGDRSPYMTFLAPAYLGRISGHHPRTITTNAYGQRLTSWLILAALRGDDLDEAIKELAAAVPTPLRSALLAFHGLPPAARGPARARLMAASQDVADAAIGLGAPRDATRSLQAYIDETLILTAFDSNFLNQRAYRGRRIVGMTGCGDLTMNLWNVAYINSPLAYRGPRLMFLPDEPIDDRTYSCLVKWKPGIPHGRSAVTIEDIQFFSPATNAKHMARAMVGGRWTSCGDWMEFAVSNQQVILVGKVADISRLTHQFRDLRHLLVLPNLNPGVTVPGLTRPDQGRGQRKFFGDYPADDVWFGEKQLLDDINLQRAAMNGPVVLSRLYGGLSITADELRGMLAANYTEVPDPGNPVAGDFVRPLQQAEYRFMPEDDRLVEIYFRRNVSLWNIIGLSADNRTLYHLACDADRPKGIGLTLEKAAEQLRNAGAHNALLIDEGFDVFQAVAPDDPTDVAVLQSKGVPSLEAAGNSTLFLTIPDPRRRTRLRAAFLFAR